MAFTVQIAKRKRKKRFANVAQVDEKYLGPEPSIEHIETGFEPEYHTALNWYNYFFTIKDGRKWLEDYVKENYGKEVYRKVRRAHDKDIVPTACWIVRMMENGTTFGQHSMDYLDAKIKSLPETEEAGTPTVHVSPHDRAKARADFLLEALEEKLDEFYNTHSSDFDIYAFFTEQSANPIAVNAAKNKIGVLLKEVEEFPDDFMGNGKVKYRRLVQFYEKLLADLDRLQDNKRKVRKPRKVAPPSTEKIIKNLKFLPEFQPMQVVSVKPETILGAKELWVYHTKYRLLGRFVASDDQGLGIAGTKITNFDAAKSVCKKLRKPLDQLQAFAQLGKVGLRTYLETINAMEHPQADRITKDTILLKVVK